VVLLLLESVEDDIVDLKYRLLWMLVPGLEDICCSYVVAREDTMSFGSLTRRYHVLRMRLGDEGMYGCP
jgi:hypothetical protein